MNEFGAESTEMDTEYDIIEEMNDTLKEIEETCRPVEKDLMDKISYIKFLLSELDSRLSGKCEILRHVRFIVKKTP